MQTAKIPKVDIATFQKRFQLDGRKEDYFFVNASTDSSLASEPYRTELFGIALFHRGNVELRAGLSTHAVTSPAVITMGPTVIRSWHNPGVQLERSILFFTEAFFQKNQANVFYLKQYDFFENNNTHVLKLNEPIFQRIESIFNQIKNTLAVNHVHEAAIIRSYIYILLHEIDAAHRLQGQATLPYPNSTHKMVLKFKNLLILEFCRQRSVSFYAEQLHVTPKYLSEKLKAETGKTVGQWIDEMILLEAKVLLQNNELSILAISEHLGFKDQSVFGKFFKKQSTLSPANYRKKSMN